MSVTEKPRLHQDWIDPRAHHIVRTLQKAGYTSYLVGGCVRDLLLGQHPKDFDIATNATPDQVRREIHRAYVIGKRFRLVLVRRDDQQYEVSTFRREMRKDESPEDLPEGDNIFGTPIDDAKRRDFTINALFYDSVSDKLIDFADGLKDLENGWVRMIGDPFVRLAEDPIRILRALRLKHMISFALEPELRKAMCELGSLLPSTALPRRREEMLKWLKLKNPELAFREAWDMGLLHALSPTLAKQLEGENAEDFFQHLRAFSEFNTLAVEPKDFFARLVYAYVRAFIHPESLDKPLGRSALENEGFQAWMREELGMFKTEQAFATKALTMQAILKRRVELEKKGLRRQQAVHNNEAFELAFTIAQHELSLSCDDLRFWAQPLGAPTGKRPSRNRKRSRGSRGRRKPKQETPK